MIDVYLHSDCKDHVTPPGHPEQIARIEAVERGISAVDHHVVTAPLGAVADILRCHPQRHVDLIRHSIPDRGLRPLDGDTFVSAGSWNAALRAIGGACMAVDTAIATGRRGFVATRPPGHHAERETPMGFCLFGNAAIATKRALDHHGLQRVAVLDFDVHHGNGTQDLLWGESRCRFISSHQMPLYPGTGHPNETGAHGQITNLPLASGSGTQAMRAAWQPALAALTDWQPELIILSAGFDAHRADPLAGLNWTESDFAWITREICDLADECCQGRVVSVLEGGYDLDALADSVTAHLAELGRNSA